MSYFLGNFMSKSVYKSVIRFVNKSMNKFVIMSMSKFVSKSVVLFRELFRSTVIKVTLCAALLHLHFREKLLTGQFD